ALKWPVQGSSQIRNPCFQLYHRITSDLDSHDLHQGKLGNCWFVAACSCLALRENLWRKVIPDAKEQDWDRKRPEKYTGIFHFQFWCFGEWTDVVIDDRLPTMNNELIFCHSNDRNEFWCALLEKAYAKMAGCYEALDGGSTAEAIVDFTGAVAESIDLSESNYSCNIIEQAKLFEDLLKVHRRGGLISCYITPSSSRDFEGQTETGLIKGHAYSVTAVVRMSLGDKLLSCTKSNKLFMIRLRNPWGKKEWIGAWSDESEEWKKVSRAERKKLGLTIENNGEFWMTFEDWCKNFTDVDICRIVNTSLFSIHKTWEKRMMYGQWTKNPDPLLDRSGGCFNNKATFLQNPQYAFDVKKAEDKVLVSLQQKDRRIHKKDGTGGKSSSALKSSRQVEDNRECLMHKLKIQEKVATSAYIDSRMVFLRVLLKQGRYVLIPTTFSPGIEAEFILRLFTDVPSKLRELQRHKPWLRCLDVLCGIPRRVTQTKVHEVGGLQSGANPYVIVKCENSTVRSPAQKGKTSAIFNTLAIFYRRKVRQPILIQVWHRHAFGDRFLGEVRLVASPGDSRERQTLPLQDRRRGEADQLLGHLTVQVLSSDDFLEL
ncbi:hypothetical protein JRQ81_007097, partial [Phrynocephalus forsythii]